MNAPDMSPNIKPASAKPIINMKKKEDGTLIQPSPTVQAPQVPKPPVQVATQPTEDSPREIPQNVLEELLNVEK